MNKKIFYAEKHDSKIIFETRKYFFSSDELAEKFVNEMNMLGELCCKPWDYRVVSVIDNEEDMREIAKEIKVIP